MARPNEVGQDDADDEGRFDALAKAGDETAEIGAELHGDRDSLLLEVKVP
jgi:hypothetical protein